MCPVQVTTNEVFYPPETYLLVCGATVEGETVMSSHYLTRRTLVQVTEDLSSDEEEVISFACRDIASNTDLHEMLSEINEQSSHLVILELLHLLKRFDLIKKHYKVTKVEVESLLKNHSRAISDYRYLIIELNEEVEENDLKSIVFLLKAEIKNGVKPKKQTFLSLVVELEKNQLVTPSNLDLLKNVFQTIHRIDLKKKIIKLQQKDIAVRGGPYINAFPASGSPYRINSSACSSTNPPMAGCSSTSIAPVQESLTQYSQTRDQDERYIVRKNSMGFCLIIDCVGNDGEMLKLLFGSLNFVVQCHLHQKVHEVEEILYNVANMEQHRNHDIFICVIISRGNADSLFCLDGDLPGLSLERIKDSFTGQLCPNLRGKPKLFFIQNYLARDSVEGQEESVEVDGPREGASSCQWVQNQSKIPNEADIFWSQCRVDELELQRSSGSTSLYLRSLRDLLNDEKIRKHQDLLNIHTELNHIIYKKQAGYYLQLRHTLTKKLFLYST